MPEQKFDVEVRQHPWGSRGVNTSLEEVAKRATAGAIRPEVRTWAVEILDKARKAGRKVNSDRLRANEILKACQAKLWVPDPIFAEYIPPARLLACEKHGDNGQICIKGDDCDGILCLMLAAMMSVGLFTMVVGHGYGASKQISHVLGAVRLDGKWNYADPSTPEFREAFPLGEWYPFTHERLLSTPNVQVLCDADVCLTSPTMFDPETNKFIDQGIFVGVNGVSEEVQPGTVPFDVPRSMQENFMRLAGVQQLVQQPAQQQSLGSLGSLGGFGFLGLAPDQEKEAEAINKGLSHTEMILLAGTVISGIGLIWNITRDKRASTQGTPGAALATSNPTR